MPHGSLIALFYTSTPTEDIYDTTLAVCETVGLDVESTSEPFPPASGEHALAVQIPVNGWSITLRFELDPERVAKEPALTVGGFTESIDPKTVEMSDVYWERMNVLFELFCRLGMVLETGYVAMIDTEGRPNAATPSGRPITEHVETPPPFGVYTPDVLDDLGGVSGLFENAPWYVAELTDGRTVVIESASPWNGNDWEPPMTTDYIEQAELRSDENDAVPSAQSGDVSSRSATNKWDPFATLETGEYGADVGVHPDDISSSFSNETLQLVRVYVDDQQNLRRADDQRFVRKVVEDAGNDEELVKEMLVNIPPESTGETHLVSALIHEAVPPAFVQFDGPSDENVVTRVMALDIETNKYDLLVSLGRALEAADGEPVGKIETTLENLAELDKVDGIERWIDEALL